MRLLEFTWKPPPILGFDATQSQHIVAVATDILGWNSYDGTGLTPRPLSRKQ
jgi:hypothetical protein